MKEIHDVVALEEYNSGLPGSKYKSEITVERIHLQPFYEYSGWFSPRLIATWKYLNESKGYFVTYNMCNWMLTIFTSMDNLNVVAAWWCFLFFCTPLFFLNFISTDYRHAPVIRNFQFYFNASLSLLACAALSCFFFKDDSNPIAVGILIFSISFAPIGFMNLSIGCGALHTLSVFLPYLTSLLLLTVRFYTIGTLSRGLKSDITIQSDVATFSLMAFLGYVTSAVMLMGLGLMFQTTLTRLHSYPITTFHNWKPSLHVIVYPENSLDDNLAKSEYVFYYITLPISYYFILSLLLFCLTEAGVITFWKYQ